MLLRFPPWKVALVLATLVVGLLLTMPNLLSEQQRKDYFGWWPTQPLKLGLDLKGGASISLEIPEADLRANELREVNRMVGEKLRETPLIPVRERNADGESIIVRVANAADAPRALERLRTLGGSDVYTIAQRGDGAIEIKFTDARFDQLMERAVEASRQAIQRRADNSGLVEPNIVKQGENRVLIEIPGLTQERVNELVDLLTQAGVLTFNMVDTQADPSQYQIGVPRNNRVALPDESLGGKPQVIMLDPIITGNDLSGAQQSSDQYTQPNISFQLHGPGPRSSAAPPPQMSAGHSQSFSTTRSSPPPRSIRRLCLAPARSPAASPCRRRTTSPSCWNPVSCRQSWWWSSAVSSTPAWARTRSRRALWRPSWA